MDQQGLPNALRLLILQFRVKSTNSVPAGLNKKSESNQPASAAPNGQQFLKAEEAGIPPFVSDLFQNDCVLVDGFWQGPRYNREGKEYYVARFIFAAKQYALPASPNFNQKAAAEALKQISGAVPWNLVGYENPYFEHGETVEGQCMIMVDMIANHHFQKDGKPILHWRKDKKNRTPEDVPVPAEPRCSLRLTDGHIYIE